MSSDTIAASVNSMDIHLVREALISQKELGLEHERIRLNLERALRSKALTLGDDSIPPKDVENFLNFVIELAKSESYLRPLTVVVLQDVFDISTTSRCERLFSIVEHNIDIWKTPYFFDFCKNLVLRMCNDLLKRLSRTIDTNFCGKILILLARSLPLNERSGLNLPGQFNVGNLTAYDDEEKKEVGNTDEAQVNAKTEIEDDVDMEVGEIRERETVVPDLSESGVIPFDYGLYVKFWDIQRYFVNPNLLFETSCFKEFQEKTSDVLNLFTAYKLEKPQKTEDVSSRSTSLVPDLMPNATDDLEMAKMDGATNGPVGNCTDSNRRSKMKNKDVNCDAETNKFKTHNQMKFKEEEMDFLETSASSSEHTFFAKYLTSQKLFQLQLADSQFRRYFLCQTLIIANYISSKAKQKDALELALTVSQEEFLQDTLTKCYSLLKETYPSGYSFVDSVKKILGRENLWSQWKGDSCPDIVTELLREKTQKYRRRDIGHYDPSVVDLGSKELTRLWSACPDNLAACKDQQRSLIPPIKQFLSDGLDELDPEQEVEAQYMSVNDEKYQWWASRYLLSNSDQYMTCAQIDQKNPAHPTSVYLKKAIFATSDSVSELHLTDRSKEVQQRIKKRDEKLASEMAERLAAEEAKAREQQQVKDAAAEAEEKQQQKKIKLEEDAVVSDKNLNKKTTVDQSQKSSTNKDTKTMDDEERRLKRRLEERHVAGGSSSSKPSLDDERKPAKRSAVVDSSETHHPRSSSTTSSNQQPEATNSSKPSSTSSTEIKQNQTNPTNSETAQKRGGGENVGSTRTTSDSQGLPPPTGGGSSKNYVARTASLKSSTTTGAAASSSATANGGGASSKTKTAPPSPTTKTSAASSSKKVVMIEYAQNDKPVSVVQQQQKQQQVSSAATTTDDRAGGGSGGRAAEDHRHPTSGGHGEKESLAKQTSSISTDHRDRRRERGGDHTAAPPSSSSVKSTTSTNGRSRSTTRTPPPPSSSSAATGTSGRRGRGEASAGSGARRSANVAGNNSSSGGGRSGRKDGIGGSPASVRDEKPATKEATHHNKRSAAVPPSAAEDSVAPAKIQRRDSAKSSKA